MVSRVSFAVQHTFSGQASRRRGLNVEALALQQTAHRAGPPACPLRRRNTRFGERSGNLRQRRAMVTHGHGHLARFGTPDD